MFTLTARFILLQKRDERTQSHGSQNKLFPWLCNLSENECLSAANSGGTQETPEKPVGLFPRFETALTAVKMPVLFLQISAEPFPSVKKQRRPHRALCTPAAEFPTLCPSELCPGARAVSLLLPLLSRLTRCGHCARAVSLTVRLHRLAGSSPFLSAHS